MGLLKWIALLLLPVTLGVVLYYCCCSSPTKPDVPENAWWGLRDEKDGEPPSAAIETFEVKVAGDVLNDLRMRLLNTRYFDSLPESNFEYGFNAGYMREVAKYWHEKFDWKAQQAKLNQYPQFTTVIEGIGVHFVHVKPPQNTAKKVTPLLMIHGWPGSFWEFYKIIPMLTGPGAGQSDVTFELIIPSIPGYGFSEAPHRRGFDVIDAARIFNKLMKRLGHTRYYIQGGDWGGAIAHALAKLYDSNVIGIHVNFAPPPIGSAGVFLRQLIGVVFPSLIYTPVELATKVSLKDEFINIMRESGYMHLQATRPDTVAFGLNDSPVGLAAYILEKFGVWSNLNNRFCQDGCITKHFTLDEVLTNVMIYWVTGSIASSVRFYRETLGGNELFDQLGRYPVKIPTGVASFPNEIIVHVESLVRYNFHNVVQYTVMPKGGHFAAFEEPRLMADDVISFVKIVEKQNQE